MKEKFLPIGTICQIKGNDKKVMITGYLKSSFNNCLKTYDYIGIIYPEGMLVPNRICVFDAVDITQIIYHGLENEEYHKFKNIIKGLEPQKNEDNKKTKKTNGTFATPNSIFTKLVFDENGVVMFAEQADNNKTDFEFDENGYVIREKKKEIVNPFFTNEDYKFDENVIVTNDKKSKQNKTTVKDSKLSKDEQTIDSLLKEEDYEFNENIISSK